MTDSLKHYLDLWSLSEAQPLAETVTSTVYAVQLAGEKAVLKLLKPYGVEEQKGALVLRYFDGQGAVRLLRDDDGAQLLEYAGDEDLLPLFRGGRRTGRRPSSLMC